MPALGTQSTHGADGRARQACASPCAPGGDRAPASRADAQGRRTPKAWWSSQSTVTPVSLWQHCQGAPRVPRALCISCVPTLAEEAEVCRMCRRGGRHCICEGPGTGEHLVPLILSRQLASVLVLVLWGWRDTGLGGSSVNSERGSVQPRWGLRWPEVTCSTLKESVLRQHRGGWGGEALGFPAGWASARAPAHSAQRVPTTRKH